MSDLPKPNPDYDYIHQEARRIATDFVGDLGREDLIEAINDLALAASRRADERAQAVFQAVLTLAHTDCRRHNDWAGVVALKDVARRAMIELKEDPGAGPEQPVQEKPAGEVSGLDAEAPSQGSDVPPPSV